MDSRSTSSPRASRCDDFGGDHRFLSARLEGAQARPGDPKPKPRRSEDLVVIDFTIIQDHDFKIKILVVCLLFKLFKLTSCRMCEMPTLSKPLTCSLCAHVTQSANLTMLKGPKKPTFLVSP